MVARVRRDLIDDAEAPILADILKYPMVKQLLKTQEEDGSFPVPADEERMGSPAFMTAWATLRALDKMADLGVRLSAAACQDEASPVVRAAQFLLASQNDEGGLDAFLLGDSPDAEATVVAIHFHGWATSALCRVGYEADERIDRAFDFLLNRRQDDGGWAWRGVRTKSAARPSSHLITGMVLRAFAASEKWHTSREAKRAAELLATRFMQPDRYPDRKPASHWEEIAEPRMFTDVLDALDTVTSVGLGKENSGVRTAEAYVRSRQYEDGLWYPGQQSKGPVGREKPKATPSNARRPSPCPCASCLP